MLFNTVQFFIFFVIVYALYLILNHKQQNRLLLVASYIFYATWDWRFLSLLFITTAIDYYCGLKIYETGNARIKKLFLLLSIFCSLIILCYFKYYNFFAASLQTLLSNFNFSIQPRFLDVILPVGISFYTFKTISYTIDIYRNELKPTKKFLDFALLVSYFPQLIAGPIERASSLLPQILSPRRPSLGKVYEGSYLIFWGLFQKVFVADNLAKIVDPVFMSSSPYNGTRVILAIYAFAFQIYCDFAGYSNIARGLGKLMGFETLVNFNLPYFSTNPREFWQRWHISLSTWLRDYLYIPLGGNRKGTLITYRNLAITMLLGGLWHGANWTFIIWGAYQGFLLIAHRLCKPLLECLPSPKNLIMAKIWFLVKVVFFFHVMCLGWLLFRAESVAQVFQMLSSMFPTGLPSISAAVQTIGFKLVFFTCILIIIEAYQYRKNDLMALYKSNHLVAKALIYYLCFYAMMIYGVRGGKEFIYFQF